MNVAQEKTRDPANDRDWSDLAAHWQLREDTIYLNHGSFGLAPNSVRYKRREWIRRLDEQPMDFFLRQLEPALEKARTETAEFVGTVKENLVFADNATYAMNVVARSFKLEPGDEVLINNHEYGAVLQIWQRACEEQGATLVCVKLPERFESKDQIVDAFLAGATEKTRLAVFSHITSATALLMPAKEICSAFRERGIATCIDGPHAPAHIDLNIDQLDCDFYTASCHKWLCATLGSGFLYVHSRQQNCVQPPIKSWGRLDPAVPESWDEQFTWLGTRDSSGFLTIPTAIEFMNGIGLEAFRARANWLRNYVQAALIEMYGTEPIGAGEGWYGTMAHVPLPPGDWTSLQEKLWEKTGIEVMIVDFEGRHFIRVSCHLYNNTAQLDTLVKSLHRLTIA